MLQEFLAKIAREMGFDYFALAEHIDLRMPQQQPLQIHNYPRGWPSYYVERDLGPRDPIRRASHRTHLGFAWLTIPRFLTLTPADRAVLAAGQAHGLGEGFTVAFGTGVHICAAMHLARIEMRCLFKALVKRVVRFEAGAVRRDLHQVLRGLASVEVTITETA